jgi:FAD:protein FMN transferase
VNAFRAMGTDVVLPFGARLDEVQALFDRRERRFSRFLPASELNRVNDLPSGAISVSEELASMLSLSLDAARATGGLVTPAVGGALMAAGYDRDFDDLPSNRVAVEPVRVPPFTSIALHGRLLLRSEAVILDLNGVVKSKTVDDALALLGRGWVSAGGDIAASVPVVVGLPGGDTITLQRGGLATSSVARRRWGDGAHHLIDPRTGAPSDSPWREVTVAADTCLVADVTAKAALLLGTAGPSWLDRRGLAGRFVAHDGSVGVNETWRQAVPDRLAA